MEQARSAHPVSVWTESVVSHPARAVAILAMLPIQAQPVVRARSWMPDSIREITVQTKVLLAVEPVGHAMEAVVARPIRMAQSVARQSVRVGMPRGSQHAMAGPALRPRWSTVRSMPVKVPSAVQRVKTMGTVLARVGVTMAVAQT